MKNLFWTSCIAASVMFFAWNAPAMAAETKKVCVEQKDAKTNKTKQVCKEVKIHKKLEGREVPGQKK